MKERTIEEKLFHQLMRLERMMKRPEHDERRPEEGEEEEGPVLPTGVRLWPGSISCF